MYLKRAGPLRVLAKRPSALCRAFYYNKSAGYQDTSCDVRYLQVECAGSSRPTERLLTVILMHLFAYFSVQSVPVVPRS